ncbi:hypothetical protein KCU65_g177, partial [Aureobasidium melanogenum]
LSSSSTSICWKTFSETFHVTAKWSSPFDDGLMTTSPCACEPSSAGLGVLLEKGLLLVLGFLLLVPLSRLMVEFATERFSEVVFSHLMCLPDMARLCATIADTSREVLLVDGSVNTAVQLDIDVIGEVSDSLVSPVSMVKTSSVDSNIIVKHKIVELVLSVILNKLANNSVGASLVDFSLDILFIHVKSIGHNLSRRLVVFRMHTGVVQVVGVRLGVVIVNIQEAGTVLENLGANSGSSAAVGYADKFVASVEKVGSMLQNLFLRDESYSLRGLCMYLARAIQYLSLRVSTEKPETATTSGLRRSTRSTNAATSAPSGRNFSLLPMRMSTNLPFSSTRPFSSTYAQQIASLRLPAPLDKASTRGVVPRTMPRGLFSFTPLTIVRVSFSKAISKTSLRKAFQASASSLKFTGVPHRFSSSPSRYGNKYSAPSTSLSAMSSGLSSICRNAECSNHVVCLASADLVPDITCSSCSFLCTIGLCIVYGCILELGGVLEVEIILDVLQFLHSDSGRDHVIEDFVVRLEIQCVSSCMRLAGDLVAFGDISVADDVISLCQHSVGQLRRLKDILELERLVQTFLILIALLLSSHFGSIAHCFTLLVGKFIFFNKVGEFVGIGSGFAAVGSTIGVGHLLIVTKDVVDAARFVAISVFAMTTLQALELALRGVLVEGMVVQTAVVRYLLFLTTKASSASRSSLLRFLFSRRRSRRSSSSSSSSSTMKPSRIWLLC